jgi:glycosyltransferase involved in cell wall biosynthesis
MREIKLDNDNPLVSVVIPAYNAERYIAKTLDCLMQQTLRDFEILIVNDGSTDGTKSVIEKFFFDRRIRYFEKANGGTGSALNIGHREAKGKYITWCSADNIYMKNFLMTLSQCLDITSKQGVHFVYSDFLYIDQNDRVMQEVRHNQPQPAQDLINGYDIGMSFMYTKELWDNVGDYSSDICEDFNWVIRAAEFTRFALIKSILACFRVHQGQITGSRKEEEAAASSKCKALAMEYLKSGRYNKVIKESMMGQYSPQLVESENA